MKRKKIVAGLLAVLMIGQAVGSVSALTSETENSAESIELNDEGLWLTEIYHNDVDRSVKNDTRQKKGYETIKLYESAEDLMEFIELRSTYDESINLNEKYEIYYENTLLNVTDMNGNSDITIEPEQTVVLWNCRSDIEGGPTEADFREEMKVPDNAVVLKINNNKNWAAPSARFTLKTKADGKVVSTFNGVRDTNNKDGFSVELKVPVIGSNMVVYHSYTIPSAGYSYSAQLNGLAETALPAQTYAEGVYLTELRPYDSTRSEYGVTDHLMECIEIVNTTGSDVDLNTDYQVQFFAKEGTRLAMPVYNYDETSETHIGSSENCIIPAGGSAVVWVYRGNLLTSDFTRFPTMEEFRTAYNIPEGVPAYIFANKNGLTNGNGGFELYQLQEDGSKNLVSSYCYDGSTECKKGTSVQLAVNPEGPEMLLYKANATSTMGTVDTAQYTYSTDDGSSVEITLDKRNTVPESITQGDELRLNFYYGTESTVLSCTGVKTYYRLDGEGEWYSISGTRRVPNLYELKFSADTFFDHEYVEFFVCADNRYRSTITEVYKVDINQINAVDGIRTNISDGEEVGGTVSVTANDGADNANTEIYIDGTKYDTTPMLEDGAYLNFTASDRANYYKALLTTTENEQIAKIGKWQYAVLDNQIIKIDNSNFTYNAETNTYDTTLRFWAGTYGTTVEDYLLPSADRDEYSVSKLALKLANGNVYYPTSIGPDNAETNTNTNLSTDYSASHTIGDAEGHSPYFDVSFSVPATEVTAVGAVVDTNNLSNGEHTLKVTNGTSTKEVNFIVDNNAPVIELGVENGADLTGNITIAPQVTEENTLSELTYTLDDVEIETPYETTAYKLGEGEHTLTAYAEDEAGNYTTETATFTISDVSVSVTDAGTTDITDSSASLYLTVDNTSSDAKATFYRAEKVDTADVTTNTSKGILPYIQYTINVGEVANDDLIVASWDGTASNSDDTHASTMYVLNTVNGKWDKIAKADAEGSIAEASFVAENHVADGQATIIVQCTANSSLPDLETETDGAIDNNANWDGNSAPEDYDFCFAWETDTQYYAQKYQYHFLNMNQWIVDNAEEKKIKYVIHTGDIVNDYDLIYEWENADEGMKILDDAGMPYGVLGGNHDVAGGIGDNENYYTYFGEDRFTSQETYGGSYKNNLGHYDLISEDGQDFIIVYMSWNVYQEEIDWMNDVLEQYSDRKAILCFHPYTNVKQSNGTYLDYFGKLIQQEVVAKNENVFAVLNGHYHGSSYETAMFDDDGDGVNDRTVYQICTDYQSGFEGGSEYIKFLYFDLDNDKIYMNSYSPYLDDYNYFDTDTVTVLNQEGASGTALDEMVLDLEFNSDEQTILENQFSAYVYTNEELGTTEVDKTTGKATLDLTNLEAETDYAWYAVVENANTGYVKTGVYEFTTKSVPQLYGDANLDGAITVADATLIQKIGINMVEPDAKVRLLADVNGDDRVSIVDATYIQKYLAQDNYDTKLVGTTCVF